MNQDKKYLVEEVAGHLNKSDYVFLSNFERVTVHELAALRKELETEAAEFHVVKNNILRVALKSKNQPELDEYLKGHTAIITGGKNPSGVAKILFKFGKEKEKGAVKSGIMSGNRLSFSDIEVLSNLPPLPVLQAQLLSLFNTPAQQCARVLNGVPQGMLNVLQAKSELA